MGGSFFVTLRSVFAALRFQESEVGQQPVNTRLVRCGKFSGLFESRACGNYFINNAFKTDSQRWTVLVANCGMVFKVVLLSLVVRCSPLNAALYAFEEIIQYEQGSIQKLR